MNLWILCPNLWGARLFVSDNPGENPRFYREFHPRTRVRREDFEIEDDLAEFEFTAEQQAQMEAVAQDFSDQLSTWLETRREHASFDSLLICAEGHFLRIFLAKLGESCREMVIGTIKEDLYEVNETDLASYVPDERPQARASRLPSPAA